MRRISLYIKDQLVDLDKDSLILLNFTQDDLNNPAVVKNSYSQSITLQGTPTNNKVFSHLYRFDFESGNIDTLAKTPFVIYDELGEVLQRGYVKVTGMHKNGKYGQSYDITLYGGLGGFFYLLSANEDGTSKTLADLYYNVFDEYLQQNEIEQPKDMQVGYGSLDGITKEFISKNWGQIEYNREGFGQFINFVPAYNGYPSCKFSANKAVYHDGNTPDRRIPNLYTSSGADSADPNANGNILLEMDNKHTEWEVQDLRSYLQRPAIRIKKFLEAIGLSQNIGDYHFVLDHSIFGNIDYIWYENSWMTLPMFDRDRIDPTSEMGHDVFLRGTKTPADYLISLAKVFGLVFAYDPATNTISLLSKNEFYSAIYNDYKWTEQVDLTERIDTASIELQPFMIESRYLLFQYDTKGQFAEEYQLKYGRVYGSQKVDTGLAFNNDAKNVMEGIAFKGAVDVLETSQNYRVYGGGTSVDVDKYPFKFAVTESVKWKLYQQNGTELKGTEYRPAPLFVGNPWYYNPASPNADFMTKLQLHSADNKADEGENILCIYQGMVSMPHLTSSIGYADVRMHLSDDTAEMLYLNNGEPCWDVAIVGNNILDVAKIPNFRRYAPRGASFDFGVPFEVAFPETYLQSYPIYENWWKRYINDRYDKNAKIMTCKVNLTGMQVGQNLLRQFYYYDGALWSLNAIRNHSLTTDDLTECEFVKVKDIVNYEIGQLEI